MIKLFIIFVLVSLQLPAQNVQNISVSITGSILSDACHEETCHGAVAAKFEVADKTGKTVFRGASTGGWTGSYYADGLIPGQEYEFIITDSSYLFRKYPFEIPNTDKYDELSMDFLVIPKVKGLHFNYHIPPFEMHKSKLRHGHEELLEPYEILLKQNPDIKFQIESFPDDNELGAENLHLTYERCEAIKNYYISKGIEEGRISIMPNIEVDPMNPPPTRKSAKGKRYVGSVYLKIIDY